MKKTLLGLALGALTTVAFADVSVLNTSTQYGQGSVQAYGKGTLAGTYSKLSNKQDVYKNKADTVTKVKSYGSSYYFDLKLGLNGNFVTVAGTNVFGSFDYMYKYRAFTGKQKNSPVVKDKAATTSLYIPSKSLELNDWEVGVTFPKYGTLTLGNVTSSFGTTNTFSNSDYLQYFQITFDALNSIEDYAPAPGLGSKFYTINYELPSFAQNLTTSVSYSHHTNTKLYSLGALASYNWNNTELQTSYGFTHDSEGSLRFNQHSFEFTASNSNWVKNLTLTGDLQFSFDRTTSVAGSKENVTNKDYRYSVTGTVAYECNQYLQPYLSLSLFRAHNKGTENGQHNDKTTAYESFVGVNSNVYNYHYVNVNTFVEANYTHVRTKGSADETRRDKQKLFGFAVGVTASF